MLSSARRSRPGPAEVGVFLALAVGLALALSLGGVIGASGGQGFLLLIGGLVAIAMLRWPFAGFLVLLGSIAVENLIVLESARGATGTRLLGVAVFGAWGFGKLLRRESLVPLVRSRLALLGGALVAMALLSVLWARVPQAAFSGATQLIQFVALAVLTADMARSWKRLDAMVKVLVMGGTLAAILTLEQAIIGGARRAGDNIAGGINATALLLVTLTPLAFYLIRSGGARGWGLLGVAYVGVAVPAVVLTYSRMNLLVLPMILGLVALDTLRGRNGRMWVVMGGAIALAVGLFTVPTDRLAERAATIVPYLEGTIGGRDSGFVEPSPRGYHLRLGIEIARDHPVVGAGFRNYGHLFREEYQFVVPGPGQIYYSVRSPHSSHVGMMADLGMVGFALWVAILLWVGFIPAFRVRLATRWEPEEPRHLSAWAFSYAIGLQLFFYGWYNTIDRDKLLWVLVGAGWAIWELHRLELRDRPKNWESGSAASDIPSGDDRVNPVTSLGAAGTKNSGEQWGRVQP
jgi:O-antigen ligase